MYYTCTKKTQICTAALLLFTLGNANNKKRANTINLNFVILKNTVRLKNGDNAADVIFH